jgi:hypothetical protein
MALVVVEYWAGKAVVAEADGATQFQLHVKETLARLLPYPVEGGPKPFASLGRPPSTSRSWSN